MKVLPGSNSNSPGHSTNDTTSVLQSPTRFRSSQNIRPLKSFDDYYTWFYLVKCWCLLCSALWRSVVWCCFVTKLKDLQFLGIVHQKKKEKRVVLYLLYNSYYFFLLSEISVIQMLVMFRGKHRSIHDVENLRDLSWRNHTWRKQCSTVVSYGADNGGSISMWL